MKQRLLRSNSFARHENGLRGAVYVGGLAIARIPLGGGYPLGGFRFLGAYRGQNRYTFVSFRILWYLI